MFKFSNNTVTILRKKGDDYCTEHITANTVLPGTSLSEENIRRSVVERLRKDPMVLLVLEPEGDRCDEEYLHPSGFRFHVTVQEGEVPSSTLRVTFRDTLAFEDTFSPEERAEGASVQDEPDEVDEFNPEDEVLFCVRELLHSIDENDYYFVMDSCPYFVRREPGEDIDLEKANALLQDAGFQTERLSTVAWVCSPVLFVHENDMVLLGSRHFDGECLFLEMKRFFNGVNEKTVEEAIRRVKETDYAVKVIRWEDGSWSFRMEMDEETDVDNFLEQMNACVGMLRSFIGRVEDHDGVGEEPWSTMAQQRHYFIHETLSESAKLNALKV